MCVSLSRLRVLGSRVYGFQFTVYGLCVSLSVECVYLCVLCVYVCVSRKVEKKKNMQLVRARLLFTIDRECPQMAQQQFETQVSSSLRPHTLVAEGLIHE